MNNKALGYLLAERAALQAAIGAAAAAITYRKGRSA